MNSEEPGRQNHRLADAYRRMLERAAGTLKQAAHGALPTLQHLLHSAKQGAVELKELTRDEAERIAYYLKRDLEDAAQHMRETGEELADWLRFDIELVEERLQEAISPLVDHTREELERLAIQAEIEGWHTGEVTGPGTLFCEACGQEVHFHQVGHIPPCPKCKAIVFHRKRD